MFGVFTGIAVGLAPLLSSRAFALWLLSGIPPAVCKSKDLGSLKYGSLESIALSDYSTTVSRSANKLMAVKSVRLHYIASDDLSNLFGDFRMMCNDAIRIAMEHKPTSRFKLIALVYPNLTEYGLHTHYILSACEVAYSIFKNKMRRSYPHVVKSFLKLDNQSYRLDHLLLRIPSAPRHFIFLRLSVSKYHLSFIDDPNLRRGAVTITESGVTIAFSKEVKPIKTVGDIGVDINERNVTISTSGGFTRAFGELGEVAELQERYREIRAKIGRVANRDNRVGRKLIAKFGKRERVRTAQRVHKATREIVNHANERNYQIKLEKMKGIRKLYRKGNGQGAAFRARMNTWVFGATQRQIDYKSKWDGVPVWYVNPRGTSTYCLCGSRVVPLADRKLYCPSCDRTWDRDDLASKNIMACAVPQVRPSKGSCEGERGDDGSNPPSRWREAESMTKGSETLQNFTALRDVGGAR
jgi:putative transposase